MPLEVDSRDRPLALGGLPRHCFNAVELYQACAHDGTWAKVLTLVLNTTGTPWLFREGTTYRIAEDVPGPAVRWGAGSAVVDGPGRVWFLAQHGKQQWLWTIDAEAIGG